MNIEETLEKILKKIELLEIKIDDISAQLKRMKSDSNFSEYDETPKEKSGEFKSPSEILMEKQGEKPQSSEGGRMKCNKCGSINIQAVDNKDKVVNASGGIVIYAKRYYCKKCGNQWD